MKKTEEIVKEEVKEKKVKSVSVYSSTGVFVREYTEEQSDKGFSYLEKAKGYAEKIGGTVK